MKPGDLVADRFVLTRLAGAGGMGEVWLAHDRIDDRSVALKRLHRDEKQDIERFRREAQTLGKLLHPGIVRHVTHGVAADGSLYLAMEWLEGETLHARLRSGPLPLSDALAVVAHAALALGFAHARGVVHRDVKPSNLFLVDGEPGRLKVLDFGLATTDLPRLTRSGALVGTVGYMAPEQAMGRRQLDPRADVFALGCVLFECLTGRPAFSGEHQVAVLCKLLLDEVPDLGVDLPHDVDALVMRMLATSPEQRPADGAEVAAAIAALDLQAQADARRRRSPSPPIGPAERRWLSVIVVRDRAARPEAVEAIVARFGGRAVAMIDGSMLVTLRGEPLPDEQAVRAARCVIALRSALPHAEVAVASGSSEPGTSTGAGSIVDRAASLLGRGAGVHIDAQTEQFLHGRFRIRDGELRDEAETERPPPLLGRATACFGRDKELALLGACLDEAISEPTAKLVTLIGEAGVGKTRVRQEFVHRARTRPGMRTIVGRGDPVYADSPFGIARQLVRAAVAGDGLAAHLDELGLADRPLVGEFLAELVQAPVAEASAILRAARADAGVMGEQLERAFRAWLEALGRTGPTLVVVDDAHWADAPSVGWLVNTARALVDLPLLLLVLGRPETRARFPRLRSAAAAQDVGLGALGRGPAREIVRAALPDVSDAVVARIVARADGNAFYLEELVRHVAAQGSTEELPDTVVAMARARLDDLDDASRLVLRAASVYGETFWGEGVAPLVGESVDLPACLDALVQAEVIERVRAGRFAGQREYAFHHGLLRDAAYGLLTDADRVAGHRRAGEWLEGAGEQDPVVLAEHFERGADGPRAVPYLVASAQAAEVGVDLGRALNLVERGLACGAEGELHGKLLQVRCNALALAWQHRDAVASGEAAFELLVPRSPEWFANLGVMTFLAVLTGDAERLAATLARIGTVDPPAYPSGPYLGGMLAALTALLISDRGDEAQLLRGWVDAATASLPDDPVVQGWSLFIRTHHEEGLNLDLVSAARTEFERGGDRRGMLLCTYEPVFSLVPMGRADLALATVRPALDVLFEAGPLFAGWGRVTHSLSLAGLGEREACRSAQAAFVPVDPWQGDCAVAALALGEIRGGNPSGANPHADALQRSLFPGMARVGHAIKARLALEAGRADEALTLAERGLSLGRPLRTVATFEPLLRLAHAEALAATGAHDHARAAIVDARARVLRLGAQIDDEDLRSSYLSVPENARTLLLAQEWGAPPP